MTPGISNLAKIAKVDGVGPNPETPQHYGVQRWCDLYPTQPFGRPREREGWWREAAKVERGGTLGGRESF
jgi:hypothetical protein